ncbi:tetratricopeptide repeat protein [Luedemannella helvata]|uniref:Tetratricopeptide repeat protein n=1 Tax=Luedemannella helvata TaxID=349315 RepID=A0ABN2KEK2_9ACTN
MTTEWEQRLAAAWASLEQVPDDDEPAAEAFRARIDALASELPDGSGIGYFERACAFDSTGHSDLAVPLYREALALGLTGLRRRRAVIQLASSLRNVGRPEESVALLTEELAREVDPEAAELHLAAHCVLALALTSLDRDRAAVSLLIGAIAPTLPRYQRSMANYARLLVEPT